MGQWSKVAWSTADQVVGLAGGQMDPGMDASTSPAAYFGALVAGEKLADASMFMGQALPRYEAVVWATQALRTTTLPGKEGEVLNSVLRWVDDPSDERRRVIRENIESIDSMSATALLGLAVFFSGGSVSQPDLAPILPPPEACGKFAAGAVLKAAYGGDDPNSVLRNALRIGETIASGGAAA